MPPRLLDMPRPEAMEVFHQGRSSREPHKLPWQALPVPLVSQLLIPLAPLLELTSVKAVVYPDHQDQQVHQGNLENLADLELLELPDFPESLQNPRVMFLPHRLVSPARRDHPVLQAPLVIPVTPAPLDPPVVQVRMLSQANPDQKDLLAHLVNQDVTGLLENLARQHPIRPCNLAIPDPRVTPALLDLQVHLDPRVRTDFPGLLEPKDPKVRQDLQAKMDFLVNPDLPESPGLRERKEFVPNIAHWTAASSSRTAPGGEALNSSRLSHSISY